jgi:hypothetical protein
MMYEKMHGSWKGCGVGKMSGKVGEEKEVNIKAEVGKAGGKR